PPGALPPGPLRVAAEIAAFPSLPLTGLAERVRATLAGVATERLGLPVSLVDLEVKELLAEPPEPAAPPREPPSPPDALGSGGPGAGEVAEAVTAVPGVAGLSAVLDGWLGAVRVEDREEPPSRLVRLQLAAGGGRPLPELVAEVARVATATAATAGSTARGPILVTLLVTGVTD
ncbi:nucleopolyhedrovirus P10 family protein, partial [Streptomyces triticirhizae]